VQGRPTLFLEHRGLVGREFPVCSTGRRLAQLYFVDAEIRGRRLGADGFGPDGVSARVLDVTRSVVRLQSGYVYHYAFAMLIGVAALITWYMFGGPRW